MAKRKEQPHELRTCIHCRRVAFDPHSRDVLHWPIIDDLDASDHCTSCWRELSRTRGRPLGQPNAPLGMLMK
jgi:hypothetical protein